MPSTHTAGFNILSLLWMLICAVALGPEWGWDANISSHSHQLSHLLCVLGLLTNLRLIGSIWCVCMCVAEAWHFNSVSNQMGREAAGEWWGVRGCSEGCWPTVAMVNHFCWNHQGHNCWPAGTCEQNILLWIWGVFLCFCFLHTFLLRSINSVCWALPASSSLICLFDWWFTPIYFHSCHF